MTKPRNVAALLLVSVVLGMAAGFPVLRRLRMQLELEAASSSFCACMLGQHTADIPAALAGIRLALTLTPEDRSWPQRCAPFTQAAVDALRAAWRSSVVGAEDGEWGDPAAEIARGEVNVELVAALQHFWTRDPDPTVPAAPAPLFPLALNAKPFLDRAARELDVTMDRGTLKLDFGDIVCAVDADLVATCSSPKRMQFAGPPTIAVFQRSTRVLEEWVLWKDTSEPLADGRLMVMHLPEGVAAKPEMLGRLKRPSPFGGERTYGVCRSASPNSTALFVDMDPKVAVLANGKWSLLDLEAPLHGRHIECHGETAVITEWAPPAVRLCGAGGCVPLALPPIVGNTDDEFVSTREFVSDGETLYHLEQRSSAIFLTIQSLPSGPRRVVPIIDSQAVTWGFSGLLDHGALHASRRGVLITLQRKGDDRPIVLAVDRDGSTRVLVAGE